MIPIEDFDYELPPQRIAQEPLPERDASRLMALEPGAAPRHHAFHELPALLRPGDLLVLNRSRVFPARLLARRASGGTVEVLLLRPAAEPGSWDALVRPGRRLRAGERLAVADSLAVLIETPPGAPARDRRSDRAEGGAPEWNSGAPEGQRRVRLEWAGGDLEALLERHGHVPLPPYIRRPDRPADRERYQTVYAREPGSVAAPTAGLHFTQALLARLAEQGVEQTSLVLHVGPGTFRPVTAADVSQHRVDPESFVVPEAAAEAVARTRQRGGRVVAVGTTSARVLETVAAGEGRIRAGAGRTELVIVPGFRFQVVDALITNFHLPRSSLLLLVCALGGRERVLAAYAEAVARGYRFYSYGDAMLLSRS